MTLKHNIVPNQISILHTLLYGGGDGGAAAADAAWDVVFFFIAAHTAIDCYVF